MSEIRQTKMLEPQGFDSRGAEPRGLADGLSRWLWRLQSEALCDSAMRRTGLDDFSEPLIEPALSILVNSPEREASLHPLGRFLMRVHLRQLLETRLRPAQMWSAQPETLAASLIRQPVFITGMQRSGSTFLHELLAEDPESRAPPLSKSWFAPCIGGPGNQWDSRAGSF